MKKIRGNYKRILLFVSLFMFIFTLIIRLYVLDYIDNIKSDIKITAHRGSSKYAPENTLAAIDVAIKNGSDFAEVDIQETKDGEIVILHDKNLSRTTGLDKNIWEVTLDEIKELDAGIWFNEKFKGSRIPTLEELIDYSKGKIKLNIEIKTNGHEKTLIPKLINLIKEKDVLDSCVVTSRDYNALQELEAIEPKIKTGYILYVTVKNLRNLNVDFYSVEETYVTKEFIKLAHKIGREVHVWTINEENDMEKFINLGVDNIITDNDRILRIKLDQYRNK